MASDWESEGQGFKPQQLQAIFDPGLPIKTSKIFPATVCPYLKKIFSSCTLKVFKKIINPYIFS